LATAPRDQQQTTQPPAESETDRIKRVPESRTAREDIRARAAALTADLDKSQPLDHGEIEAHARAILDDLGQPHGYLGWTMVAVAAAFWRHQVISVPCDRRLLLLPHCLRNPDICPAEFDEVGLRCQDCGACPLSELRSLGLAKGYRVLIAEGSPIVMQLILNAEVDAILGVACLNVLEKSLEKILLAGIPCMAVPLFASRCRESETDEDWVREMINTPYHPAPVKTRTYVHLLRCAARMFERDELERLLPRARGGPSLAEADGRGLAALDPVASTEAVAHDFLLAGGKHARPFITLAVYDAMTGGCGTRADGAELVDRLPDAVRRVALAMEIFHKASLVHDDIEDDDPFRYGHPTLHRKYGTSTAINVGDYLIGLGYRVVAAQRESLGADVVADILARLAEAHTRLCEGQGAELVWRDAHNKRLTPLEALKIYALKTAPAFEAALYAGLRLAGRAEAYRDPIARYARHLGVAFQILNDLDDWQNHQPNKRMTGTDILGGRPTVLWALGLEAIDAQEHRELESLPERPSTATVERVREIYQQAGVYRKANQLVDKHHQRACEVVDQIEPAELRHLLQYLADSILKR